MDSEWQDNLYRLVLQQTQDGIILSDADGTILFVNDAAEKIRNIKRESILGHNIVNCHKDSSHEKVVRALAYLKTHQGNAISRMVTDTANDRYYENVYSAVFDEESELQGVAVVSRDITERRKAEETKAEYQIFK